MKLVKMAVRLASRRGTLLGVGIVALAVALPLALRRSSRRTWALPARPDARETVGALRERSREAVAVAASTAGRVRSALVPAGA